jgi:hypothetical protein
MILWLEISFPVLPHEKINKIFVFVSSKFSLQAKLIIETKK